MIATQNLKTTDSGITVERMVVTPDHAVEWLESANTNNRRISDRHVHRLARDMVEGKWMLTHVGIAFDSDGTLLDGQHRLWAIWVSGVSVEMFVWRNVDERAMMAIDCGKTRSMADILNIAGENGDVRSQHLAALRAMLGGFGTPPNFSPSETSEALRIHGDAIQFAMDNLPAVLSARGVNTAIARAVIARAYYSVDHSMLEEFCRMLTTGIVTSPDEGVIVLLRQHLQQNRSGSFGDRMQRYGKVQRTLKAWLKGQNPSRIYPALTEQFPLPEETRS